MIVDRHTAHQIATGGRTPMQSERTCITCGAVLVRKKFPATLETRSRFVARQSCGPACAVLAKRAAARPRNVAQMTTKTMPDGGLAVGIPLFARNGEVRAYAYVDEVMSEELLGFRWSTGSIDRQHVYARRSLENGGKRLMHRQVIGAEAEGAEIVDHINGDTLDNRRANLRPGTQAQNLQNRRGAARGSRSRFRGVYWNATGTGAWVATTTLNGRDIYLGRFNDECDAARVAAEYRAIHMPFSAEAGQ